MRRTSLQEDELVKDHINKMYQRDVIRPSNSSWASPILLVQKKNGKTRFCVDYRKLNEVSIKDAYPLPRMDDIFSVLGKASYYSTIDLTDAFWSIRVREEDIPKTAFITKYGLWEFISMPFGLTNAPATQQRFIEAVLQGLLWECCFAYIDDILCYSNSFRNHTRDLRNIFSRLRENNLIIQPPKCALCRPAFEILGYVATPDGIKPSKKKLEALKKFPLPASVKETQSFLGIVSWFRRFIENCSARSQHLRACASVKDPSKFKLTPEAKKEFELLKEVMATEPCLAHPKLDEQLYIHVDASIAGLGAILTQPDDKGRHRVIEYASKAYDSSTTTGLLASNSNREAHGTIWALDHFKYYVKGRYPIVYCDCKCLLQVLRSSAATPQAPKLKAWVARMLKYCPRVVHKPGKLMAILDALSRMHMAAYCSQTVNDTEVKLLGSLFSKAMENEDNPRASLESQEKALQEIISHGELDPFDVEVGGLLDTCSPYLFITEKIFSELKGRKVRELIKYKGVGGKVRVQEWGKKVSVVVPGGSTSWTAYPIAGDFGVDALVSWPLAQKLGAILEGLPKFFCSKVRVSDDKAWTEEEGKFSEKPLLDKVRERIKKGVRKALEDNARLLKNSCCKLRDCEFVVELEKGARPIFKRPYPIPEAFWEAVNNCCQEWLDNGWVKLLPPDQRNNWNSPLLAVKKVSGNKWLGDIRLCMDFRWVNALTLDPAS